ncbi:MAG: ABC transporter substrate-binding protein [Pseudomonadales bacterium]|nr:ABC transporter substrate-binding protein [Pseudomonadales bacterium]
METIWYTRCPVPTASGIAFQRDMFAEEFNGPDFEVRNIKALGRESADTHFNHSLNNSFREGGSIPPLWAKSQGADTLLVGLTFISDSVCIYVRPDSDIKTMQDLAGKRVSMGVRPYIMVDFMKVNAHKAWDCALRAHGMSLSDVELVEVEINDDMHAHINPDFVKGVKQRPKNSLAHGEMAALARGDVDAIWSKSCGTRSMERKAADRVRLLTDLLFDTDNLELRVNANPRPITVSGNLAREHPEAVIRYLQVLIRAARWAAENPANANDILATELGVSATDVKTSQVKNYQNAMWPNLTTQNLHLLQTQQDFMLQHGYLSPAVDLSTWTDDSFLRHAYEAEGLDYPTQVG